MGIASISLSAPGHQAGHTISNLRSNPPATGQHNVPTKPQQKVRPWLCFFLSVFWMTRRSTELRSGSEWQQLLVEHGCVVEPGDRVAFEGIDGRLLDAGLAFGRESEEVIRVDLVVVLDSKDVLAQAALALVD